MEKVGSKLYIGRPYWLRGVKHNLARACYFSRYVTYTSIILSHTKKC